jgi:hypothetical protein
MCEKKRPRPQLFLSLCSVSVVSRTLGRSGQPITRLLISILDLQQELLDKSSYLPGAAHASRISFFF